MYQRKCVKGGKGALKLHVPSPPFFSFCPSTLQHNESLVVVTGLGSPLYCSAHQITALVFNSDMKTRTRNRVHKQAHGSFSHPGGKQVRQSNCKVLVCPVQNKPFLKTKAGRKGREHCKLLMSGSSRAWGENSRGAAYG